MIDDYETGIRKIKDYASDINTMIELIRKNKTINTDIIRENDWILNGRLGNIDYSYDRELKDVLNDNDCVFRTNANNHKYNTIYPCSLMMAVLINKVTKGGFEKESKLAFRSLMESFGYSNYSKNIMHNHKINKYELAKRIIDEIELEDKEMIKNE